VKVFTQSHYNLIVSQYSEVIIGNDQIVVWPVGCLAAFGGDGHKTCACAAYNFSFIQCLLSTLVY
jgi:hypothetical protein